MPEPTRNARQGQAVLNEARSVLSSLTTTNISRSPVSTVHNGELPKKNIEGPNQNATIAGGTLLRRCVDLVEEFQRVSLAEFEFEFKDWTVVKAVVELLVRLGIYPYLSSGVGIPLQKRFGEKAVAAAAAALSDDVVQGETINLFVVNF
jgi:hypothetical protein